MTGLACSWCGTAIEPSDGYRLAERPGDRGAAFCRLEHVVPWAMRGAQWNAGEPIELHAGGEAASCAACDAPLGERHLMLVRHRAEHRIFDGFCSVDHLLDWAKAGGRWQT